MAGIELYRLSCQIGSDADAQETRKLTGPGGVLILDGYAFDAGYRQRVKSDGAPIVLFEDLGEDLGDVDLLVNTSPSAQPEMYPRLSLESLLLGPRYALVKNEMLRYRDVTPDEKRILITFGGSDPRGWSQRLTPALRACLPGVQLHVVLGNGVANLSEVRAGLQQIPNVIVDVDLPHLGHAISQASLVVSAAGTTLFEIAALGRAMLLVTVAENQTKREKQDWFRSVNGMTSKDMDHIVGAVTQLWHQPEERKRMGLAAQAIIDGAGASRISERISQIADNANAKG